MNDAILSRSKKLLPALVEVYHRTGLKPYIGVAYTGRAHVEVPVGNHIVKVFRLHGEGGVWHGPPAMHVIDAEPGDRPILNAVLSALVPGVTWHWKPIQAPAHGFLVTASAQCRVEHLPPWEPLPPEVS